jgi:hypothetical protein
VDITNVWASALKEPNPPEKRVRRPLIGERLKRVKVKELTINPKKIKKII